MSWFYITGMKRSRQGVRGTRQILDRLIKRTVFCLWKSVYFDVQGGMWPQAVLCFVVVQVLGRHDTGQRNFLYVPVEGP